MTDALQLPMRFDGTTYEARHDQQRLAGQTLAVYRAMLSGRWLTLRELADETGAPEASISARLRDLRKPRFGAYTIERRRRGDPKHAVHEYRMGL